MSLVRDLLIPRPSNRWTGWSGKHLHAINSYLHIIMNITGTIADIMISLVYDHNPF